MKYYILRMRDKKEFEVNEAEHDKLKANMGSGAFITLGSKIINPADIMYLEYSQSDLPKLEEKTTRPLTDEEKEILGEQMKKFKPKFLH